jgi:hypothetical protein
MKDNKENKWFNILNTIEERDAFFVFTLQDYLECKSVKDPLEWLEYKKYKLSMIQKKEFYEQLEALNDIMKQSKRVPSDVGNYGQDKYSDEFMIMDLIKVTRIPLNEILNTAFYLLMPFIMASNMNAYIQAMELNKIKHKK